MKPNFLRLARDCGHHVRWNHLEDMRASKNDRDREFYAGLAKQCARAAATHCRHFRPELFREDKP